jgi:outer membrane protein TolC
MQRCRTRAMAAATALVLCAGLRGQVPPETVPAGTRVIQQPLSGRAGQQGGVATVQSTSPGGVQSVNTIISTVQVQGAYQGSVPSAQAPAAPLTLTLDEAVRRGLQFNLGPVALQNLIRQAQGIQTTQRANLLPQISGALAFTEQQTDLAALGFGSIHTPAAAAFPTVLGPFHYFDFRAGLAQSLLDITRMKNYRASQENVRASQFAAQDARDLVVLAVTGGYLQLIASSARIVSAQAQVTTAQATFQQASDRFNAGLSPRIDATRSQVELQMQQQRLTSVQNDFAKQKISFGRLIGLPPAQDFSLSDTLPYAPVTDLTLDQALLRARANRADLKAADSQVKSAELAHQGARAERLPTLEVSGNYGVIGTDPTSSHGTFGVTGALRFPIWQGGRVRGDIEQAEAALSQRRAEQQDLQARVDAEVRSAFLDLNSAASQVTVAQSNRSLANDALVQARDRFASGVADTLEVVQAQEAVAAAEQDYIASLYAHNLAKATLARAMGQADQGIKQFLGRP